MKKLLTVLLIPFFFQAPSYAQLSPLQQKAIMLKRMIELKHYAPRPVDDSFAVALFRTILQKADPRRILFTSADYQQLLPFNTKLDDELRGNSWGFMDKFQVLYKQALLRADTLINKAAAKPFDYSANESITFSKDRSAFNFSPDNAGLLSRWTRRLKYSVLDEVADEIEEDSVKKTTLKAALAKLEPSTREAVKKAELKSLQRVLNYPGGFTVWANELYLGAIASCFDPHTNYFSPLGKEEFKEELSTEGYFFGITFGENEAGKVIIERMMPGGPAWKSGEIHKDDEVLSLQWEGKEMQDMSAASLGEVLEIVDQSNHDKLLFRLRKKDGTISNVSLRKEKLDNEENIVKSFILNGEKKIGYILLPGFYTEWENETGSSCANDVAKEIVKLKRENIDGLILDVRYNGGGSLQEALEMTGIFIEEGPLTVIKERGGKLSTLKDPNRGTIYDGPMVLMVNGQSASASELLAASLQDYHRAIIAGSNTYGKATMQAGYPVDTMNSKPASYSNQYDMVKITNGKLFRVSGTTAQLTGVQPDVLLPDAFDGLEIGERYQHFPLEADSVKRNNYYKPLPYLPVSELANKSAARVIAHPDFKLIKKIVDEQQQMAKTASVTIPLNADQFEKWRQQQALDRAILKGVGEAKAAFTVDNHVTDKLYFAKNAYAKETNKEWLEELPGDIYLQEVYLIISDLINLKKNTAKN